MQLPVMKGTRGQNKQKFYGLTQDRKTPKKKTLAYKGDKLCDLTVGVSFNPLLKCEFTSGSCFMFELLGFVRSEKEFLAC